jgi:hypothetical protein
MIGRRWGLIALGFIFTLLTFASIIHAEPAKSAPNDANPFKGKILLLWVRSGESRFGAVIENPHIRRLGDVSFLVGEGVYPEEGKDYYNGRTVWIPIAEIRQIVEYPNREAMLNAKSKSAKQGE